MASAKRIRGTRILAAVGAVLLMGALAVLGLAWRSMSYEIEAAPVAAEETITLRVDDFSMDVPKSFTLDYFTLSLNWPEARILLNETWSPDSAEARRGFEESKKDWADRHGEVIDISGQMGFPAVLVPRLPVIDLAERPVMLLSLVRENVQLGFVLMLTETPADLELWQAALISRVRDFVQFYQPSPDRDAAPEGAGVRAEYGTVAPGPRDGYEVSVGFASFSRGGRTFQIHALPGGERFLARPGFGRKLSRFFRNLNSTGYLSGIGVRELSLDGAPGHEIVQKHPFLGAETVAIECDWQEIPQNGHAHALALTLTCAGDSAGDPPACYGQWRQLLESVPFTKQ